MSGVRERIADALRAELEFLAKYPGVQISAVVHIGFWAEKFANALLSLPGIDIVELPDLDGIAAQHITFNRGAACECCPPGVRDDDVDVDYSVSEARAFAAALLAAADAAEGVS